MSEHIEEELYLKILASIPIPCVDVVIVHNGNYLLVKRKQEPMKGEWWFPGGRINKNEFMLKAAHRKTVEEVCLFCNGNKLIHTAETIFATGVHGIQTHTVNHCFLLYSDSPDVRLNEEHSDYTWERAIHHNTFHPYVKDCLKAAGFR